MSNSYPPNTSSEPRIFEFRVGDTVREIDAWEWGNVVEVCERHGILGARVLWTGTGDISWTPFQCIELMYDVLCDLGFESEETESSVDERLSFKKKK